MVVPAGLQDYLWGYWEGEATMFSRLEGLLDVSSAVPETKMDKVVFSWLKLEVLLSELLWGMCPNVLLPELFPGSAACSGETWSMLELDWSTRTGLCLLSGHSVVSSPGRLSWANSLWLIQGWGLAALVPRCDPPLPVLVVAQAGEPPDQPFQPTESALWWHRALTLANSTWWNHTLT